MRFYLSSFKLGSQSDLLGKLYGSQYPVGYIANALDHVSDREWHADRVASDMAGLENLGLNVQRLDLRDFFDAEAQIEEAVSNLSGIWISGGNVFVLRQAMQLSGLDSLVVSGRVHSEFVYGGYSAGCCVLSPSLRPYSNVDDPRVLPYAEITETLWDGLGILDFAFMPHFQSEHPESLLIEKEIEYCDEQSIRYRTFRDGDVLVI